MPPHILLAGLGLAVIRHVLLAATGCEVYFLNGVWGKVIMLELVTQPVGWLAGFWQATKADEAESRAAAARGAAAESAAAAARATGQAQMAAAGAVVTAGSALWALHAAGVPYVGARGKQAQAQAAKSVAVVVPRRMRRCGLKAHIRTRTLVAGVLGVAGGAVASAAAMALQNRRRLFRVHVHTRRNPNQRVTRRTVTIECPGVLQEEVQIKVPTEINGVVVEISRPSRNGLPEIPAWRKTFHFPRREGRYECTKEEIQLEHGILTLPLEAVRHEARFFQPPVAAAVPRVQVYSIADDLAQEKASDSPRDSSWNHVTEGDEVTVSMGSGEPDQRPRLTAVLTSSPRRLLGRTRLSRSPSKEQHGEREAEPEAAPEAGSSSPAATAADVEAFVTRLP